MNRFEKYYPYEGEEFRHVMAMLADNNLACSLFPELSPAQVRQRFASYSDVGEFQADAMLRGCRYVVEHTMSRFTWSGTEYLDGTPSMFISNHRDIVLDAMLLQYLLISLGRPTSHVVVGTNLFEMPLMQQLARVNKMFGIDRGGNRMEYYHSLIEMSAYLRHLVTQRGESVWIAQRNGRTKDGTDCTDPALVHVIASSGNGQNPVSSLDAMHIVPLCISYEWEPCGWLKAREMCLRSQGPYAKAPGEDTHSIVSGIKDYKGHVHLTVCPPIRRDELETAKGDRHRVAALIDSRIAAGRQIYDNNRAAKAMLHNQPLPANPAADAFRRYVDDACTAYPLGQAFRTALLRIYASPLESNQNTQ